MAFLPRQAVEISAVEISAEDQRKEHQLQQDAGSYADGDEVGRAETPREKSTNLISWLSPQRRGAVKRVVKELVVLHDERGQDFGRLAESFPACLNSLLDLFGRLAAELRKGKNLGPYQPKPWASVGRSMLGWTKPTRHMVGGYLSWGSH